MDITAMVMMLLLNINSVGTSSIDPLGCLRAKQNCYNMSSSAGIDKMTVFNISDNHEIAQLSKLVQDIGILELWNGMKSGGNCSKLRFCQTKSGPFIITEDIIHCNSLGNTSCIFQTDECNEINNNTVWHGPNCYEDTTISTFLPGDVSPLTFNNVSANETSEFQNGVINEKPQKDDNQGIWIAVLLSLILIATVGITFGICSCKRKHPDKVIKIRWLKVRYPRANNCNDTNMERQTFHQFSTTEFINQQVIHSEIDMTNDKHFTECAVEEIIPIMAIDLTGQPYAVYHTVEENVNNDDLNRNISRFSNATAKDISTNTFETPAVYHVLKKANGEAAKSIGDTKCDGTLQRFSQNYVETSNSFVEGQSLFANDIAIACIEKAQSNKHNKFSVDEAHKPIFANNNETKMGQSDLYHKLEISNNGKLEDITDQEKDSTHCCGPTEIDAISTTVDGCGPTEIEAISTTVVATSHAYFTSEIREGTSNRLSIQNGNENIRDTNHVREEKSVTIDNEYDHLQR